MNIEQKTSVRTAVLIQKAGLFLFVQEKVPQFRYGRWNWVQGGVEDGETPKQAAIREAKEETGFDVHIEREITILENPFPETSALHVFLGSIVGGELSIPSDELLDVRWFSRDEISGLTDQLAGEWILPILGQV